MASKSQQLQIRVTPAQKATLRRLARGAGQDVSTYVLSRALPPDTVRFADLLSMLRDGEERRFVLAELNDLLTALSPLRFPAVVERADLGGLSGYIQNYVAAMVEQAAYQKGVPSPSWTSDIMPLAEPHFAVPLKSVRLHLLRVSPIPFKRRNIFVDAAVGDRT